ncbi:hypothetical protein J6590_064809 [Homalodisca vitripennis]|nr:hypothetical protein J6590_064809 [Homalodisca vitripennis]
MSECSRPPPSAYSLPPQSQTASLSDTFSEREDQTLLWGKVTAEPAYSALGPDAVSTFTYVSQCEPT